MKFVRIIAILAVGVLISFRPAYGAVQTATNGILTVSVQDAGSEIGQFTIVTGASHPQPGETVFFPISTSNVTLRDVGAAQMWVNDSSAPAPGMAGYTTVLMNTGTVTVVALGATGFRTTYVLPNFTVVQDVVINGTTLADTNVRHDVTVTNTTTSSRQFGLRYLWDWEINGNDASYFRPRNPDGTFTNVFGSFTPPSFALYEIVDNLVTPSFSVFGTVAGGSLSPAPTAPEELRYASWSTAVGSAWDFPNTGSGLDSATLYYWGNSTPLTLAAGANSTFTQYVSTVLGAVGGTTTSTASTAVPTTTEWTLVILSALMAFAAVVQLRRRQH